MSLLSRSPRRSANWKMFFINNRRRKVPFNAMFDFRLFLSSAWKWWNRGKEIDIVPGSAGYLRLAVILFQLRIEDSFVKMLEKLSKYGKSAFVPFVDNCFEISRNFISCFLSVFTSFSKFRWRGCFLHSGPSRLRWWHRRRWSLCTDRCLFCGR